MAGNTTQSGIGSAKSDNLIRPAGGFSFLSKSMLMGNRTGEAAPFPFKVTSGIESPS